MWLTYLDINLTELEAVAEFLQKNFGITKSHLTWSKKYFEWKLSDKNPAGSGYLAITKIDNNIVGTASITKKHVVINGKKHVAGEIGDTYTLSNVRREKPLSLSKHNNDPKSYVNKSMFGRMVTELVKQSEKDNLHIVYGTPNNNSYPGYIKRLDFQESLVYCNYAYSRPRVGQLIRTYPAIKPLRHIVNLFDKIYVSSLYSISQINNKTVTVETSFMVPETIGKLSEKLGTDEGFSLDRSYSYWEWRYERHPLYKYNIQSFYKDDELSSVIVSRKTSLSDGRRGISIAEWIGDKRVDMSYMLSYVMHYYKSEDVDVILLWGDSDNDHVFKKNIFFKRNKIPIIFHKQNAVNLNNVRKNILFFMGSSDAV